MTEWLHAELTEIQALVKAGIMLVGLVVVAATYARTKAIMPTLGALLFAFVVVWAVNNSEWFDAKIDAEFNSLAPSSLHGPSTVGGPAGVGVQGPA